MRRPAHSTNVLTTLQSIVAPIASSLPEPKRPAPPTRGSAGLFIVGDLVLVPGRGPLARATLSGRASSMPR